MRGLMELARIANLAFVKPATAEDVLRTALAAASVFAQWRRLFSVVTAAS